MARILDREISVGPFHGYPNRLEAGGDGVVLHFHEHDHLAIFDVGGPYEVFAVEEDGRELTVEVNTSAGIQWAFIPAQVRHRIRSVGGPGGFLCLFSRYDRNGRFLPDPKEAPHG
jgi:hypothetical protein